MNAWCAAHALEHVSQDPGHPKSSPIEGVERIPDRLLAALIPQFPNADLDEKFQRAFSPVGSREPGGNEWPNNTKKRSIWFSYASFPYEDSVICCPPTQDISPGSRCCRTRENGVICD